MFFKLLLSLLLLTLAGCSSFKKNVTLGTFIGGTLGASGGYLFSPDEESRNKNAYLFGMVGAAVSGLATYYLLKEKPKKERSLLLEDKQLSENLNVPFFDISEDLKGLPAKVEFKPVKKYEVPKAKLPKNLEGKVKRQVLIEYQTEGKTLQVGNKTIEIAPFKAWEVTYE